MRGDKKYLPDFVPRQPIAGKCIIWEDGKPISTYIKPWTTPAMHELIARSAQIEYKPRTDTEGNILPAEQEYLGKSKYEAAIERCWTEASYGDQDRLEWLTDRMLGKPKQQVESVSMSMTYQDFIKGLPPPTEDELEDAQIVAPQSSPPVVQDHDPLEGLY